MSAGWARASFVGLALAASIGLGLASARRTFGWVRGESADGRQLDLRGRVSTEAAGQMLNVVLRAGGERVEVTFPARARAADGVPATVALTDASGVHRGSGTLHVEEAGSYLGGTLEAHVDGWTLHGGLRVRAVVAAPERTASVRHGRPARGRRVVQ